MINADNNSINALFLNHGRILWIIARMTVWENGLNRLPWAVLLVLSMGIGLAYFLGAVAITEEAMIQGAVTGAFFRFCAVFLLTIAVIASVAREFNDRMVDATLALAIPRAVYFGGKLIGFIVTAIPMAAIFGLILIPFSPWDQVVLWSISLGCELILMAALSLFLVLTLTHVTPALAVAMVTYMLARSMGTMVLIASGPYAQLDAMPGKLLLPVLQCLSWLLPDLGRFTSGEWLAYHTGNLHDLGNIAMETIITLFLLCGAGLFDLYRKNI
ncbi:MAG: hypothetical protein H7829_02750 [Magnetococcus sp. THC-1_WYH]